jgi:uroporphyrinogen decarboxylase
MWSDPVAFQALLDKLADAMGDHLQAQVEAGAAGVQLFDTWLGALSVEDARRWALPAAARALARVKGVPRLYFTRESSAFLPYLHETGADGFALDWRAELGRARATFGPDVPVQGNLDPTALFAPPDEIRRRVHDIIRAAGPRGHVFNLGHGIHQETPISGVSAAVEAVKEWTWT